MEEWKRETIESKIEKKETFILYLYTPICGTCQVASKMLVILKELMPKKSFGKSDVNYIREFAEKLKIESVPCLLLYKHGRLQKKMYAFNSVPYLLDTVRKELD